MRRGIRCLWFSDSLGHARKRGSAQRSSRTRAYLGTDNCMGACLRVYSQRLVAQLSLAEGLGSARLRSELPQSRRAVWD